MRVLVTGGAGYIGSVVAGELLRARHEVVVLDNLSAGHREAVPSGVRLIEADLRDRDALLKVFAEQPCDAVMHFAAFASVGDSMKDPGSYFRNNVTGSMNLFESMNVAGVKKIVFSSTCATYGIPERVPIPESNPQKPANPYGFSKKVVEDVLEWYSVLHGFRYACLRYFNASGAVSGRGEDHDPENHLIPIVLQVALGQREAVEVYGDDYPTPDGTCIRDYIHVLDLASAHILALEALDSRERLFYNLGSENGHSVLEVIRCAREVTGHPIPVRTGPRRPGDPPSLVADSTRAREELGWKPAHADLKEILQSAWEWHRTHPRGYGSKG